MARYYSDYTGEQLDLGIRKTLTPYMSHTYIAEGTTTESPSLTAATPTKVTLNVTPKAINGFTVVDLGGGNNALKYIGVGTQKFSLSASSGILASTVNTIAKFMMYKSVDSGSNFNIEVGSTIPRKITATDLGAMALSSTMELNPDDLLAVYVESSLGGTLSFVNTSVVIKEIN